jgi:hypothetical protein
MENVVDNGRKYRQTTAAERQSIFYACRAAMVDGRLKNGFQRELAVQMGFERKTICRQWLSMSRTLAPLLSNHPESTHNAIILANSHILFGTAQNQRRAGKYQYDRESIKEEVRAIPLKQRRSVRNLSARIGVPQTTIQKILNPNPVRVKSDVLIRHTSKLKPTLTELNKLTRFEFCLSQVNPITLGMRTPRFWSQYDKVHIDEKWFHLTQDGERYILVDGEEPPKRTVKHKSYILKVMFLCAQARPRWDHTTNQMWDGKLGIWPIGAYTLAQRNSINRPAGTLEWENETVDQELYRDLLVNKVLTSIMDKWPAADFTNPDFVIKVQQDGAGGHCKHTDTYLSEALEELGLTDKIKFYTQPPNSPDLNILDLGLFAALQAAYYVNCPSNQVQLIAMVEQTYADFDYQKIDRLFVTLQSIFNCIIEHHGDNFYKIPHMNKVKLQKENRLPIALEVSAEAMLESDMFDLSG